jgi:hypothetical protein
MVSIIDTVQMREKVVFGDAVVTVRGLPVATIVGLARDNPVLMPMLESVGYADGTITGEFSIPRLVLEVPGVIEEAIRLATDIDTDEVPLLPTLVQIRLIEAIITCSFPGGLSPLVSALGAALAKAGLSPETLGTA